VIAIGILGLPQIHIEWGQERQANQDPLGALSCRRFIDGNSLRPEEGGIFTAGTDVLFELSPQPDPPGFQIRWFLEVAGPDNTAVRRELVSDSLRLSELGFDPKRTGVYLWTVEGERSQTVVNIWTPLCRDGIQRMSRIAAPQPLFTTETQTFAPAASATQTSALPSSAPTATLLQNANCRRGAGTDFDVVTNLPLGLNVPIVGRNPDGSWWQVEVPGTQTRCWIAGENVDASGDTGQAPVVESPPLGCWVFTGNKNECVVPCPEGAQPGGACEP
jgi:uncharacterized protein YraI